MLTSQVLSNIKQLFGNDCLIHTSGFIVRNLVRIDDLIYKSEIFKLTTVKNMSILPIALPSCELIDTFDCNPR